MNIKKLEEIIDEIDVLNDEVEQLTNEQLDIMSNEITIFYNRYGKKMLDSLLRKAFKEFAGADKDKFDLFRGIIIGIEDVKQEFEAYGIVRKETEGFDILDD